MKRHGFERVNRAFASLIGDLGLDRASLVTTLLGFNLGIEVT